MIKNKNKVTAFNIASTVILQGLAFFSGPIFSSTLGTENYGIASVYLTWVQLASTVFSLQAGGTIAVARVNFSEDEQQGYQSSVLSLATISYMIFSVLTIIGLLLARKWIQIQMPMVILGLLHSWGLYCVGVMNSKFTFEFKANKNFILSVIVSSLTIGLSIVLINLFPDKINYWGRIIGQSSVYFIVGCIMFVYMIKTGKKLYNKVYWKFTLPISIPTIFHLLASIVLAQSDRVMLQGMLGNSAAGIYSLAATFGMVLNTLWTAFNNSWVPFYYEYTRLGAIEEMKKHEKNYIELFTILSMGFMLLAREVFHIYANKSFWNGTDFIPLFAIGYYFVFLYSFPVNFEFYHKKTQTIAIGTTVSSIINVVLNYLLIKAIGIQGAVIATVVSYGFQFLFHYFCAKHINSKEFPFKLKEFVPSLVIVILTYTIYMFTREYWIIRWIIGMILGVYLLLKIIKRKEIF